MGEQNEILWRGIRNATGDAGIEVVQATPADLQVTATLAGDAPTDIESIATNTAALVSDAIKGVLRSIGDAGNSPTNYPSKTILEHLFEIRAHIYHLNAVTTYRANVSASQSGAGTTTLYTGGSPNDARFTMFTATFTPSAEGDIALLGVRTGTGTPLWFFWKVTAGVDLSPITVCIPMVFPYRTTNSYQIYLGVTGGGNLHAAGQYWY